MKCREKFQTPPAKLGTSQSPIPGSGSADPFSPPHFYVPKNLPPAGPRVIFKKPAMKSSLACLTLPPPPVLQRVMYFRGGGGLGKGGEREKGLGFRGFTKSYVCTHPPPPTPPRAFAQFSHSIIPGRAHFFPFSLRQLLFISPSPYLGVLYWKKEGEGGI